MNSNHRVVTIHDVAKRAGVSPTTVSHVQSGNRPVNDTTAQRVTRAMLELGYTPNRAARALALGTPRVLALLVPDIANPFFAELAKGAEDAADSRGFGLLLGNASFDRARELHYLDSLPSRAVDGLIYVAGAPPDHSYLRRIALRYPIAIVDEELADVPALTVMADNYNGGGLVADYLFELGHRSVLMITGPATLPTSVQRSAGFLDRINSRPCGLRPTVRTVAGRYDEPSGYEAAERTLRTGSFTPTAIFALNDLMAIGAIHALHDMGQSVPGDVSVIGYDDTPLGAAVSPPLTTVHQSPYGLGSTAAEQLIQWILSKSRPTVDSIVLGVRLVERASASVPRGGDVER